MARVLTDGGSSGAVFGNLTSSRASNATEKHRRRKRPAKMATTAAAVTAVERAGGESIEGLYINSRRIGASQQ